GDARLREGLPLLPGRVRLPPAARAKPLAGRRGDHPAPGAHGLRGGVAALALHRRLQRRESRAQGADGPARARARRGLAALDARVAAAARGRLAVTASVSTFCPKPHTPFQWAGQLSLEETRARHALLRRELGRRRIAFRWHDAELSFLEGVFSRGDRRLADVL